MSGRRPGRELIENIALATASLAPREGRASQGLGKAAP